MPETFFLSFCIRLSFFLSFLPLILIFFSILHFLIIYSIWSLSLFCFHMSSFVLSFCYSISVHHFLFPFCISFFSVPVCTQPPCPSVSLSYFTLSYPVLSIFRFSFILYVLTFRNLVLFLKIRPIYPSNHWSSINHLSMGLSVYILYTFLVINLPSCQFIHESYIAEIF